MVERMVRGLLAAIGYLIAALLAAMVAVVFTQAMLRSFTTIGLVWAEEFARFCFVWVVFLGSVLALERGYHLGVDILVSRFSDWTQRWLALGAEAVIVVFALVVIVASVPVIEVNDLQISPALEIPMSWVYAAIPVSMALMAIISAVRGHRILLGHPPTQAPLEAEL